MTTWPKLPRDRELNTVYVRNNVKGIAVGKRRDWCELVQCRTCDKVIRGRRQYKQHRLTHTGEKPYKCRYCDKRFAQSNNRTTHERTHTGDKPYKCRHCARTFACSHHLTSHERTHTGDKPYQCGHCDKRFADSSARTVHERTHTGEKPYPCPDPNCDQRFTQSGNMRGHFTRTHTAEAHIRRKRQETRVARALERGGYRRLVAAGNATLPPVGSYVREFHVDYRCVDPASRHKFSRLDFVVGVRGGYVLLEVDEFQHRYGYDAEASCDLARMNRVMTSWTLGNERVPNVLWLRYNPHMYEIAGVPQRRVLKASREEWLLGRLGRGVTRPLGIEYAYYDVDENGTPLTVLRDGYHAQYRSIAEAVPRPTVAV